MFGAIAGDIIGSEYEFNNIKTTDFELFSKDSDYTDDTVMTVAVAKWLLEDPTHSKETLIKIMQTLGRRHPGRGYGGNFFQWLHDPEPEPYNSWGNGAGMRVSPVVFVATSLEECLELAKISAEVTHNHHEGIKGAQAIASAAYLYRHGKSKEEIKTYIEDTFNYDLSKTIEEIRPSYSFDVSCPGSCPQAIRAFLEGETTEEVIRLAISLGGDSDTIGAMAGSIASAGEMGMTDKIRIICEEILDNGLLKIVKSFEKKFNCIPAVVIEHKEKTNKIKTPNNFYNYLHGAYSIMQGKESIEAFRDVIIPMICHKFISDLYEEETRKALRESDNDHEYATFPEQHRFTIASGCHWKDTHKYEGDISYTILNAIHDIGNVNYNTQYELFRLFSNANWETTPSLDYILFSLNEYLDKYELNYSEELLKELYKIILEKIDYQHNNEIEFLKQSLYLVRIMLEIINPDDKHSQAKIALTEFILSCDHNIIATEVRTIVRDIDNIVITIIMRYHKNPFIAITSRQRLRQWLRSLFWVKYKIKDKDIYEKVLHYIEKYYSKIDPHTIMEQHSTQTMIVNGDVYINDAKIDQQIEKLNLQ